MIARTVRLAGIDVPRMGLGTNRLSRTNTHVEFIRAAAGAGLGVIDTAHLYMGGESEGTIGAALPAQQGMPLIATKGGFRPGEGRPDVLRAQIDESLRLLQTDAIELYYLHRVDPHTPLEETMRVIADARAAGQIRHVGLSQVTIEQIEVARAIVPIAAVQSHYNLSERAWDDVVDYCEREAIVFVPFFPLRGEHPTVREVARRHGKSEEQIALAWLLHRSPAMLPIPGTLSIEHVRQNIAALDIELRHDEFEALAARR